MDFTIITRGISEGLQKWEPALEKLDNVWESSSELACVSLKDMITDFLRHFQLHLDEMQKLIDNYPVN